MSNNELPLQKLVPAELMVGGVGTVSVTKSGAEAAEHPEAFVTVTVNVSVFVALTL